MEETLRNLKIYRMIPRKGASGGIELLCVLIGVILSLGVPEFVILSVFVRKQFVVSAMLDHSTVMEYGNLVAEFAGGEPAQ